MACLVNPYGWRLYFRHYWPILFYSNNTLLSYTNLSAKSLQAYVEHIFSLIHLSSNKKTLLEYLGAKCIFFHKEINILVKYRLYWSIVFRELTIGHNKMLRARREFSTNLNKWKHKRRFLPVMPKTQQNKLQATRNIKKMFKKNFFILDRFKGSNFLPNYTAPFIKKNRFYYLVLKNMLCYFYFVPVLEFYKKLLSVILQQNFFKAAVKTNLYFFAVSWRHTNVKVLLNFVKNLLFKKNFSAVKTLYTTLKVLKKWQKKLKLRGFKFLLAGRFTRRDRATYIWKSFDSVQLSTKFSRVEFASIPIQLKYSKCVAKVWLCHD